jgi:hypothetical protein
MDCKSIFLESVLIWNALLAFEKFSCVMKFNSKYYSVVWKPQWLDVFTNYCKTCPGAWNLWSSLVLNFTGASRSLSSWSCQVCGLQSQEHHGNWEEVMEATGLYHIMVRIIKISNFSRGYWIVELFHTLKWFRLLKPAMFPDLGLLRMIWDLWSCDPESTSSTILLQLDGWILGRRLACDILLDLGWACTVFS